MFDLGHIGIEEPAKKLINQGMIQGRSNFVYRDKKSGKFISKGSIGNRETTAIHVDVNIVKNDELDIEAFKSSRSEYANAEFELENGKYICGFETEKMSKSKYNVVNPDVLIDKYGADTLRMYEMFLGPITEAKPWNTNGIEGVSKFLKRFWRLFVVNDEFAPTDEAPNPKELKALHATLKKVSEDVEKFAFNTCVSQFMICLNELSDLKCNKRQVLEPLTIALSSFAPHICEEIWKNLGHNTTISGVPFPDFDERFLVEDSISYPISFNGKTRLNIEMGADLSKEDVEALVMAHTDVIERLEGATPKKVIVVPKRIVNIVI